MSKATDLVKSLKAVHVILLAFLLATGASSFAATQNNVSQSSRQGQTINTSYDVASANQTNGPQQSPWLVDHMRHSE